MTDEARRAALIERLGGIRERWRRLVADIGPERSEQPGAMGEWTFKDVAAHLTAWRTRTVLRLAAARRGDPPPPPLWAADLGEDDVEDDSINAWLHERDKDRPLADVLAEADAIYDDFIAAVVSLPIGLATDPTRFDWLEGQALVEADFSGHLDEHEPDVRAWLARS
ncbi:MAG: maleylpyruvate isomerase N-terminal domain-containing protein [Chloroflexota bacterium]